MFSLQNSSCLELLLLNKLTLKYFYSQLTVLNTTNCPQPSIVALSRCLLADREAQQSCHMIPPASNIRNIVWGRCLGNIL